MATFRWKNHLPLLAIATVACGMLWIVEPPAARAQTSQPTAAAPSETTAKGFGPGGELLDVFRASGTTGIIQTALSLFGGVFVVSCFLQSRRKDISPRGISARARRLWQEKNFDGLKQLAEEEPSTLSRAIAFIATHRHHPMSDLSAAVGDQVSCELAVHSKRAYPLGVVATLQPLLGLLGMILGMIKAFALVALAGALGNPAQLAGGISESLATTALGIAFAIPFLAFYHFFRNRINGYGLILSEEVNSLMAEWLMGKDRNSSGAEPLVTTTPRESAYAS